MEQPRRKNFLRERRRDPELLIHNNPPEDSDLLIIQFFSTPQVSKLDLLAAALIHPFYPNFLATLKNIVTMKNESLHQPKECVLTVFYSAN